MTRDATVDEVLAALAPGETVFIPGCAAEPVEVTQRLADDASLAPDVTFVTSFVGGINERNLAGASRRLQVFFMQPSLEPARAEGRVRFTPLNYHGIWNLLSDPATRIDTVLTTVSEPDAQGLYRVGLTAEFLPALFGRSTRVIGIVNPAMPALPLSPGLPRERFALLARSNVPLVTYDAGPSNPVTDRIVANLLDLIPDGATLQVGIGKVPAHLSRALTRHRGLRVHSGMVSDGLLDLVDAGSLDAQLPVATGIVVGSLALYERVRGLSRLKLREVGYTHAHAVLATLPKLRAVNSALEIDLAGQVNAERLNGRSVSGPGGLPDFAGAAHRAPDGLSIVALPATDPKGKFSRIVAQFAPGTPAAVPSHDVDVVVTEHGVAHLRGVDADERARRLAAVAHPDFREALLSSAHSSRDRQAPAR